MDYNREIQRHRNDHVQPSMTDEYVMRWMHIVMLVSVFVSPQFGPLFVALTILLTRGEQHPNTEREAIGALNFGITVAIAQAGAYGFKVLTEFLGFYQAIAVAPTYVIALATIYITRNAARRAKKEKMPRYPMMSLTLVRANRIWFDQPMAQKMTVRRARNRMDYRANRTAILRRRLTRGL